MLGKADPIRGRGQQPLWRDKDEGGSRRPMTRGLSGSLDRSNLVWCSFGALEMEACHVDVGLCLKWLGVDFTLLEKLTR